MKRLLNLISILFGISLIISGILKLLGMFSSFTLFWGEVYFTMPNSTNLFFIIGVNFLGGISMVYHALMTINIGRELTNIHPGDDLIDNNEVLTQKEISKPVMRAGSIVLVISLWFLIRMIAVVGTAFNGEILNYLELFILVILLYGSFVLLPIVLVSKNISHNIKVMKNMERNKILAYHAKKKSMSKATKK